MERNAIVARIFGGLGNQMFMYACGLAMARRTGLPFFHHIGRRGLEQYRPFALNHFAITATEADPDLVVALRGFGEGRFAHEWYNLRRTLGLRINSSYLRERSLAFDDRILAHKGPAYLKGQWMCERYFADFADEIRAELRLKSEPQGRNAEFIATVSEGPWTSVHVRRGDYLTAQNRAIYAQLGEAYYQNAIATILRAEPETRFAVFSDEPEWVRAHLRLPAGSVYVSHNPDAGHEDMRLMAHCRHHIISNSTFSWWGAWLGDPGGLTVAPATWYVHPGYDAKDIIPHSWTLVPLS